jgi:glutathione S-transferase
MRPWLALTAAGADFELETAEVPDLAVQNISSGPGLVDLKREQRIRRRGQGSVTGLFPVLWVGGTPIHESLAICEWVSETYPEAGLWPDDPLERAQARSVCLEMATGFSHLRTTMACHVFARVPDFRPDPATTIDIERVHEIWRTNLDRSGGPFLFGDFGIPDCVFFPVLTRFRTYGIPLDAQLEAYAARLESHPAVEAWRSVAAGMPATPVYDTMIRDLGGDPAATA